MSARRRRVRRPSVLAAVMLTSLLGCSTPRDATVAGPVAAAAPARIVAMRRLTEAQYRNAIADIFGSDINVGGRFDPIVRPDHDLIATGASASAISPAGFEQFDAMARSISSQVLDEAHRPTFMPCSPSVASKPDSACAERFFTRVGPYVFRRPLTQAEIDLYVRLAGQGAVPQSDFYKGLELALAAMLVAPEFLYRIESVGPDGKGLDGYSRASRLSFLIWDSIPDQRLLSAAARGDLQTPEGTKAQVERMLASPKALQGARAFFADFLQLDRVADLSKDKVVYTRFNQGVAQDLKEQMLLTVTDHLITQNRPYPELFTTRKTFLNRRLGLLYQAPVAKAEGWQPYEIPASEDRAGILGQGAFLALFSHEGRSSPTLRGRAIREVLMCQPVPNPPANVDFSGFNDTSNAVRKTARQRLSLHTTDPVCASCHKITDPLGLPLERFDGVGGMREAENGAPIDVSGSFEGAPFDGAAALGYLMSRSDAPTTCLATRAAQYATGLGPDDLPKGWVDELLSAFKGGDYRYRVLVEQIALSPEFYAAPETVTPNSKVATLKAGGESAGEAR